MMDASEGYIEILSDRQGLPGIVLFAALLFIVFRRGWSGMVILSLVLLAFGASELIISGIFSFPPKDIEVFYPSGAMIYSAASVIIYIFFGRGAPAERIFTVVFLFSAFLLAFSEIYGGKDEPAFIVTGTVVGAACAAFVYTACTWTLKYHSSIKR